MNKTMRCLFLSAAVLLASGVAHADFKVFDGSTYDVFITDPQASVGTVESLLAFTLTVVNKTGDAAFDAAAFDGLNFGYTGITGKLHQHYSMVFDPPPVATATLDSTSYATAINTHFLFPISGMLIVTAPTEDVSFAPSLEPSDAEDPFDGFADTDFGTFLTGVFAVDALSSLPLAYIVVDANSVVTLDFFISGTSGGEHIDTSFTVPLVPEPASMSMLAPGGLTALRRRRR